VLSMRALRFDVKAEPPAQMEREAPVIPDAA